jgi:hypothetical protein
MDKEHLKGIVMGILLPVFVVLRYAPYITGDRTRYKRHDYGSEAVWIGIAGIGIALCLHAFFYDGYDNHKLAKCIVLFIGITMIIIGKTCQFS